jgi:predicted Ser/Thr protein kinase
MTQTKTCPRCSALLPVEAAEGLCPKCLLIQGLGATTAATQPAPGPASHDANPPLPDIAPHFPQLEILELLGRGGMGIVYKARQPSLDRVVALKILPLSTARDSGFEERFTREARALARLNHPHIVTIHDFGQTAGLFYFIMEYVDGVNLRQLMHSEKLSPRQALSIVPQICDALQYAHDEGIVHRDIKPENILLDKKGRVKIADFGLAKVLGANSLNYTLTSAQQTMGTPHYMAPEQFQAAADVDHRADIYSLGVVFYEMLTGQLPLGRFAPPSRKAEVDRRLDDVVLRALEKEPADRYQHVSEVKTRLDTLGASSDPIPFALAYRPVAVDQTTRRRIQYSAIALLVVATLAMLMPIAVGVLWHRWGTPRSDDWLRGFFMFVPNLFLVPIVGALTLVGALKMLRLESFKWARFAGVLAMIAGIPVLVLEGLWFRLPAYGLDWLVGLPALGVPIGIWSLLLLRKPAMRGAFETARNNASLVGLVGAARRRRWRLAALLSLILLPSAGICTALIATAPPTPLFYTFGGYTRFVIGRDGYVLSPQEVKRLGLSDLQTDAVNKIFQSYYREFVSLERRHTDFSTDDKGHVHINISAFSDESLALAQRLAAELRGVVGKQVIPAPQAGGLQQLGLFRHAGECQVTTELWKEGRKYRFEEKLGAHKIPGGTSGGASRGATGSSAHETFPEEYWIYWSEP